MMQAFSFNRVVHNWVSDESGRSFPVISFVARVSEIWIWVLRVINRRSVGLWKPVLLVDNGHSPKSSPLCADKL